MLVMQRCNGSNARYPPLLECFLPLLYTALSISAQGVYRSRILAVCWMLLCATRRNILFLPSVTGMPSCTSPSLNTMGGHRTGQRKGGQIIHNGDGHWQNGGDEMLLCEGQGLCGRQQFFGKKCRSITKQQASMEPEDNRVARRTGSARAQVTKCNPALDPLWWGPCPGNSGGTWLLHNAVDPNTCHSICHVTGSHGKDALIMVAKQPKASDSGIGKAKGRSQGEK